MIDCLIRKGWHPAIVFYEGARVCRRLEAALIRRTIVALRKRRSLPIEVRVLVEAVEPGGADDQLERDWQGAIDGLRVLFHASPIGTARQRNPLLDTARNRRLVATSA